MSGDAWQALTGHPARFLASGRPWRSLAYLLSSTLVASVWVAAVLLLLVVPAAGILVLLAGIPLSAVERWRLGLLDRTPAPSTHRRPGTRGLWAWFATRFREAGTWRELGYAVLFALGLAWLDFAVAALVLCAGYLIALPLVLRLIPARNLPLEALWFEVSDAAAAWPAVVAGLVLLPVTLYLVAAYAAGRAALTRSMLAARPDEALRTEMIELTRSRARILEAADTQRRRIERDLHDGAQQRLTGLIMTLGLARMELATVPEAAGGGDQAARELVDRAHRDANQALTELRDLVHGIHPQVLTDRGLAPALDDLAERCPVPVDVTVPPDRLPAAVEAAAWFIVAEALTNVARHSGAAYAEVVVTRTGDDLVVEVRDDGAGGADASRGTGLLGLADRVAVLDGRIMLSSPPGGPTTLRAELPCAS